MVTEIVTANYQKDYYRGHCNNHNHRNSGTALLIDF